MANHYFIFVFVSLFLASFAEDDVKIDVVKEATSCERYVLKEAQAALLKF